MKSKHLIYILFLSIVPSLNAQSLLDKLENEGHKEPLYVMSTYKGTRISIGHSIETRKKNTLEVSFMSRYWNEPEGSGNQNSFIADRMCTRFGVDYGVSDNFTIGFGTGNPNGILDGYLKYRLIQQSVNDQGSLFGVTLLQTGTYRTRNIKNIEQR